MSTRERWIVYPLLFLTLGIAMRNQFLPTRTFGAMDLKAGELSAQTIRCNNLEVLQNGRCLDLQFGSAKGNRLTTGYAETMQAKTAEAEFRKLVVADEQSKPVVVMLEDPNSKTGLIQTLNERGILQVHIGSNASGGIVTSIGHLGQALVAMGHEGQAFGVFAQFPQVGPPFPITSPWKFQPQNLPARPSSSREKTKTEEKKTEDANPKGQTESKTSPAG